VAQVIEQTMALDKINMFIFAFDITKVTTFEYVKTALAQLLYNIDESSRCPFILVGLKKDLTPKAKVSKEEVSQLVLKMKEYIECDLAYVANQED